MNLKIKRLHPDAILPRYAHEGDAGLDLYTLEKIEIKPGERKSIPVGFAMELDFGYVALIWDKSGLSHTYGLKTLGGVVDAGYRGEVKVGVINLSDTPIIFEKGHKLAQMLIQKIESPEITEVQELNDSARGAGSFGSTGK